MGKLKNVIVASGPVIIENGNVWLNKDNKDDFWKFLGGKVQEKDLQGNNLLTLENACKREVKEENDLDIEIICPLKPMLIPKPGDPNTWVILIHWLAKRKGEIKASSEIEQVKEFNVKKVINGGYGDIFAPNVKPILENYIELVERRGLKY